MERFKRTVSLIGKDGFSKLNSKKVIVFGLGGVGSYIAEALVRSGVRKIAVVDSDVVAESNINRQLIALESTIGKLKTEVFYERAKDIYPDVLVKRYPIFYNEETADEIDLSLYDYVIDAIDTVTAKLMIIERAVALGKPVISCMGTGNKLDPTVFKVADISKTKYCPLARVMRRELSKRNINSGVKVLYSEEQALSPIADEESDKKGNGIAPASISFVPSVAGLIIAGEVIKDLIKA